MPSIAHRAEPAARRLTHALLLSCLALLATPLAACTSAPDDALHLDDTPALVAQDVTWTRLVNATATGSSLKKTGGLNQLDDAGALSQQSIIPGNPGGGWLEFTASETSTYRCVGLGAPNAGTTCGEIAMAFRLQAGIAEVRESGAWRADTRFVAGDVFRLTVAAGKATYAKNGVAFYSGTAAALSPLYADAALIDSGATITGAKLGLPAPDPWAVTWTLVTNATVSGTTLTKTGGVNQAEDAGAASQQSLGSDGALEITASEPATFRCVGLAQGVPGHRCAAMRFAWRLQAGIAEVREGGVYRTDTRFVAGDNLRIEIAGAAVRYRKNGVLVFTSALAPGLPLRADAALIDSGATVKGARLVGASPSAPPPPPPPPAPAPTGGRCGWILLTDPVARAAFNANASYFTAIHPDWYALNSDGVTVRPILAADDAAFIATAKQANVALIPMVAGVDSVADVRTMLYSPANRAAHIQTLVALAVSHNYAGLDLDYEHLWDPADRAPLAAFIRDFGAAMHAAGKRASMAVPALPDPSSVWSYPDLAAALDEVHVMAYDFHTLGTHAGPVSPLGWVDAVGARIASATAHPERFTLGLPNYGVTPSSSCILSTCAAWCTGPLATTSAHMQSCPYGIYATADRTPNCPTANGTLFFDDTASLELKVKSAKAHNLGGITYWNVGAEPSGFFDMVKRYY